ncbi:MULTISPECIES: ACT domain-containing protein [unclassified Vibrio]|uniref:ACT domain-containing protein n=1 Tax=Vibrio sp. HB236076 TaxID=3232307 RepID=A0AB39HDZ3_9VIBR|nr:ACT domain-containing protein [Vibrio sp. HB161653]MDP5254483.1 ACT domain-containing protein [Vibrio sp. HB161653]
MLGITELKTLLAQMSPELDDKQYVFCLFDGSLVQACQYQPIATFVEEEGLTLVIEQVRAQQAGLKWVSSFRKITLKVHSSLDAVGLTAAVARALAEQGISANVIAAYYHDHIFVPSQEAKRAMSTLQALSHQFKTTED